MNNEITKNEEIGTNNSDISVAAVGSILPITPPTPITHSIETYSVNINTGAVSNDSIAYCDSSRRIYCNISIEPGAKFKSISKARLLLKHNSGVNEGFSAHIASSNTYVNASPFAYIDNRIDTNGNIAYRVIDISSLLEGSKTQSISLAIKSMNGDSCSVVAANCMLEIEYLEDDDFIENVTKIEKKVGSKVAYSVNTRNGKLFYTQHLVQAKGGRMPLGLSMTYNAADYDNSSPNGISTGIKGWTFNYAQSIKTSLTNYTLLDGAHKYRTFAPSINNSAYKFDKSGKNGLVLTENGAGYYITDGKSMSYTFDTSKRLVNITSAGGSSDTTTFITYDSDGRISTITDGMADIYSFAYGTNTITISRGDTALVELTITDERLTQVKYLLANETYTFAYSTEGAIIGNLDSVTDSATNEKTVFSYSDAAEVIAIKNYVCKNSPVSPTNCCFLHYTPLKTIINNCRNSDVEGEKYGTTVYVFNEKGETIMAYEDISSDKLPNARFREKNDVERYSAKILDNESAEEDVTKGEIKINALSTFVCNTNSISGYTSIFGNSLALDTSDCKTKNFIFTAKALINAASAAENSDEQYIELCLRKGATDIATLKFDPQRRGYQAISTMIKLEHGTHDLVPLLKINNVKADIVLSNMLIYETNSARQTERIDVLPVNASDCETDNENTLWYVNEGNYTLQYDGNTLSNVKFTTKDYNLTTLSRKKNPNSFNLWYNDGENMLANVSSAKLSRGATEHNIADVRCCSVTDGIEKTVFSSLNLVNGVLKSKQITRTNIDAEDGPEFFVATTVYNDYMKPVETINRDGVVTQHTYNEFGEMLTEKTFPSSNIAMNTLVSKAYANGNLASTTERRYESEYTRMFEYNPDDTLDCEITPNGQYIYRSYSADGEKITQLSATVSGSENSNDMAYNGDLLLSLTHNGTEILFGYDGRNNVNCVNIANAAIISKETTYNPYGTTQSVTTYGNGAKIKKYYDKYDRLIRVTDVTGTEIDICSYIYSRTEIEDSVVSPTDASLVITSDSKLRAFVDNVAGTRTKYLYDEFGNVKEKQTGNVREYISATDKFNRPTAKIFSDGSNSITKNISYDNDYSDSIASEFIRTLDGHTLVNYSRDALKRLASIKVTQGVNGYRKQLSYVPRGASTSPEGTTNYIESISYYNVVNNVETFEKTENVAYNTDGHIATYGDNTYVYDRIGRLIRENNKALDKTYVFVYNIGGNIVSRTEYVYTEGELGTPVATYNYAYGNAWKDQLTAYNGSAITYDASGNPTIYLGATLTWNRGRFLASYLKGSKTVIMQYDANGFRRAKTRRISSNTLNSSYVYSDDGKLLYEKAGTFERYYFYSADGIVGYEENGEMFWYKKNFFGDITAVYRGATKIAEYVYDAWGNCTVKTDTNGYGSRNPFRYRGYYWDSDLAMYYLITRYYDPAVGRFISADSTEYLEPGVINGLNLYAYCGNNPVMNVDPMGTAEYVCWTGETDIDWDEWYNGASVGDGGLRNDYAGGMSGTNRYCGDSGTVTIFLDEKNAFISNSNELNLGTLQSINIDWNNIGEKALFYVEQGVYYTKVIIFGAAGIPAYIIFVPLMAWADKKGVTLSSDDVARATQTIVGATGNYTDSRFSGRMSSGIGDKVMSSMFGEDNLGFYDFLE